MDTFIYKCPSCGGKVEYNLENHKWKCEYCGNSYETLFNEEQIELPNIKAQKYELYLYKCHICQNKFLSLSEKEGICTNCQNVSNEQGKKISISNIMPVNRVQGFIYNEYIKEIKKYRKKIPPEYFENNFEFQYINCDLYNGCVKVSYNNKSFKYIFLNLLVPNVEYEDYRFMFEVGNIGFASTKSLDVDNKNVEERAIRNANFFNSFIDKDYKQDFISACIYDFMKNNNLITKEGITVEEDLEINDGFYIPMYRKKIQIGNNIFRQYKFGNIGANNNNAILEFEGEKDSTKKVKIFDLINRVSLAAIVFMTLFFFGFFSYNIEKTELVIVILIISYIILFFTYFKSKALRKYYFYSIKLTREEYFDQIINNSNYIIKVVKGKR